MSSQLSAHTVREPVPVGIPDEREYDDEDNAELDRAMCDAIAAAEQTGDDYLTRVLANELGSHYYSTR